MRKTALISLLLFLVQVGRAQQDSAVRYRKTVAMIPMRDGVKLFTVILTPVGAGAAGSTWGLGASGAVGGSPILINRTPYGADIPVPNDSVFTMPRFFPYYNMAKDGYIFVIQDVRGKYKSEGTMEIHQPLVHLWRPGAVDESTDTWDAVDWLIRNVPGNNGKAGITGVSYPGWLALVGAVDPHPALKAASEQACMGDLFLGDDFHHNGAFRLSYGMEYSYEVEHDKTTDSDFPFPQFDLYDWYLRLGSLKHVNERYFHGTIPTWNNFVAHPAYDSFWKTNSTLSYVKYPAIPQLHVGGYYDQEDLNGPQLMYGAMEKRDTFNRNYIVLGPWYHGEWESPRGDSLGKIAFGSNTSAWFKELQKKWFDYWLRGIGDGKFDEANCFQTGSNVWKTYSSWPPREAVVQNLYAGAGGRASFVAPTASTGGSVRYVSDPAKPVPYRQLPIEATYGRGSHWRNWHVDDQRFVYTRPDVVSFMLDSLTSDLTVTGSIIAHLWASTTGTDADWVVKLIDVYPNWDGKSWEMSGYMLPVAMEVFRGRFVRGFDKPGPLVPGKPEEFVINLHQINHVFKKGHRVMVQVQSSWFPIIDRNPQRYVSNIFEANDNDFIKAEETVWFDREHPTRVELPVMR
jgi:putative CocE/NonD family hydrolase